MTLQCQSGLLPYGLNDSRVCYVRYEDLATKFELTMTRVFSFLSLEWSEEVREFARKAEERRGRTPSYRKVRQGLIGVQSSYCNYSFLFAGQDASPLQKSVDWFGYDVG